MSWFEPLPIHIQMYKNMTAQRFRKLDAAALRAKAHTLIGLTDTFKLLDPDIRPSWLPARPC
ncbi:hypothetical protein EEB11_17175 [Pseudotabrizicola sediminis]|uniref:Uncharacterized protein n=1 Tax=Pseudotabrizicola sediminis TaxID=2486418 RepID=A0ABY2KHI8_9RHOB|nr:hypothetical protein EEB11_17175 [Pseudotabrizicola sediminis]